MHARLDLNGNRSSRTAAVQSLAFVVAALWTAVAAAQSAPAPAAAAESAAAATVPFDRQSVEINAAARGALDTLAQVLTAQGVRQVELHGYATGDDADEARKLALVRTLAVRMYLIDQGVKARIEVMAQAAPAKGGSKERVDVMTP
jgi:outer membrane protein OmpA-like peptidoglycan-associated protein